MVHKTSEKPIAVGVDKINVPRSHGVHKQPHSTTDWLREMDKAVEEKQKTMEQYEKEWESRELEEEERELAREERERIEEERVELREHQKELMDIQKELAKLKLKQAKKQPISIEELPPMPRLLPKLDLKEKVYKAGKAVATVFHPASGVVLGALEEGLPKKEAKKPEYTEKDELIYGSWE